MSTLVITICIVKPDFEIDGSLELEVKMSDTVYDVKKNVEQACSKSHPHFDPITLVLWRTRGELSIRRVDGWKKGLKKLKDIEVGDPNLVDVDNWRTVEALEWSPDDIMIIQPKATEGTEDKIPELKEFERYEKIVKTLGERPSKGAKSTSYRRTQCNSALVVYDGRTGSNRSSTIAPPIQIFHPIFDLFNYLVNSPDVQPTVSDLEQVYDLMESVSTVFKSEDEYGNLLRSKLGKILGTTIHQEPNPDGSKPDGVVMANLDDSSIPFVFLELKREVGEGGSDPTIQASLSMRRSWIHSSREALRNKCCCPTLLIAGGGPWLCVMGSVFTDRLIVQRLTDLRWMVISSTEEDSRVYHNAKVFAALRECVKKLGVFYETAITSFPTFKPNQPHPRYYPYPTSFTAGDGTETRFRYLNALEDHTTCVTYLAEITDQNGNAAGTPVKLVVKFVTSYGEEVHRFLANRGWAPNLRYYGPLRKNMPSDGPTRSAPAGLRLQSNLMQMVVMDYVDAQTKPPLDAKSQIHEALRALHAEGYVFGDLRPPNVLFDADNKVKFIDFDWSGRYCTDAGVEDGSYAHYPLAMSVVEDMWADGMKGLAAIQPSHDIAMLERLPW